MEQWNNSTHRLFRYFLGNKFVFPFLRDSSPCRLVLAPPSLILQPVLGLQEVKVVPVKVSREANNSSGR